MKPKHSFRMRGGSSARRQNQSLSRRRRAPRTWLPLSPALHFSVVLLAALAPVVADRAAAATITWIGGNVDWVDATGNTNWSPADEPDPTDDAVFNTANTVNLGSNNAILNLALSSGISLNTNNFDLTVDGVLLLTDSGTDLTIEGSASSVSADFVTINTGGRIYFEGGELRIADETATGLLDINTGGILAGQGSIHLDDALAAATSLITNDGTLSASPPGLVIGMPAAGTLAIPAGNSFARVDLDGTTGNGSVNVGRNQLLDINVTLFDSFSGDLNLSHHSTFDVSTAWSIDSGATIDIDNGAITGTFPIAANTSFIAGATFTQTDGTITVVDGDGTLQFNAPFAQSGGNLINNGRVVFNANAAIGAGANFTMPTATSSLTVNAGMEVNIDQANFNADGGGFSTNVIAIHSGGILDLDLGAGADTGFYCTTLLNGGELDVTTATDAWSLSGPLTVGASTGTSQINGEAVTLNPTATIGTGSTLSVNAASTLSSVASFAVAAGATLDFVNVPTFNGASFTGPGILRVGGSSQVTANTTIDVGTFDWDRDVGSHTHTIAEGITFTVNSPTFDSDGDMIDSIILRGNGSTLTMNGTASWNMNATLTTNPLAVGSAVVGGTSRMVLAGVSGILNANGNTTVAAPITFGSGSITTVAAAAMLTVNGDAIYQGGTITGAGYYNPPTSNTVVSSSTISTADFNFDRGNWTLNTGGNLTVAVSDYDPDSSAGSKAFDGTLAINDATLKVTSAEPTFILDGVMNCLSTITHAAWGSGSDPLDIGNDVGSLDATLNILGTSNTQIATAIEFKSDAHVFIDADATLQLLSTATFNSVNAANNAEFTGGGRLQTSREVYFNEATTINMVGGSIDLDGADGIGDTIFVKAPVIFNVATMDSFGKVNGGGGTNTLDVNHSTATGSLTVNLDNPTAEWTLNAPGALLLTNAPAAAAVTLLAGSAVNLNGFVTVTGDVRTDARVDIGGTVNILTIGEPFRLSGGDLTETNTLVGGTISGPGLLGADTGSSLFGYGTINANVDFDGNADLLADNGTLAVSSAILDARYVGTNDTDGVLNVVNAWNSNTVSAVFLKGGELQGGVLTNDGAGGILGSGLISARVVNNSAITANTGTAPLVLQTGSNNNDWDGDGSPETGRLQANAGTLELRSLGGFSFNGIVTAVNGGTVFANGFELSMGSDSALNLTTSTFQQSNGITTDLYGTITVGAGNSHLLGATTGGFAFNTTSVATLTGNLLLDCPTTTIQTGATFGGAGTLINLPSRRLVPANNANLNVLVENAGLLSPGGTGIARNDFRDFIQGASGVLELNLNGTTLGAFDRLQINGSAQLTGTLQLTLGGGYVPAVNDTLTILSTTGSRTGIFSPLVQPAGMPVGLAFEVSYLPNGVQLKAVSVNRFDTWIHSFAALTDPADKTKTANPDHDSLNNLGEFATDGDPTSGASSGKIVGKIASVSGSDVLTLTLPVRNGTGPDPADPAGGELGLEQAADGLFYKIQASDDLLSVPLEVTEVTGPDATAIQLGLPPLNPGWTYRTFRSPGPVAGDPNEFMRVMISD